MNKKLKIIAEAGVNHNGKLKNCFKLIDVASKAGADYIKFQAYKTEELVLNNSPLAKYQKKNIKKNISQYQLLKKYELTKSLYKKVIDYSKKKKIKILFSVFDEESLKILLDLNIHEFKIPSGEIDNFLLLKKISKKAKKVFLSTGMSSIKTIRYSFNYLQKNGLKKKDIVLLHCTSSYPTNLKEANMLAINHLKKLTPYVGFSDHTNNFESAILSVALGAILIEKHITLSKKMPGPDHIASIEPTKFIEYVKYLKNAEIALGKNIKKIYHSEISNMKIVKKCIVAKKRIEKNERFTEDNLTTKRPMTGIPSFKILKILGKKARKNFDKNEIIKF